MAKKNELERSIEIAGDLAKEYRKNTRAYLAIRGLGTKEATEEQAEDFVLLMRKEWPPVWWDTPDGHEEFNSVWTVDLREGFVSEPKGFWRDIKRVMERMPKPQYQPVIQPVPGVPTQVGAPAVATPPPAPQLGGM